MSQENLENILLAAIGVFDINPTKGQAAEFMTAVNRILRDAAEHRVEPTSGQDTVTESDTSERGEAWYCMACMSLNWSHDANCGACMTPRPENPIKYNLVRVPPA